MGYTSSVFCNNYINPHTNLAYDPNIQFMLEILGSEAQLVLRYIFYET